MRHRQLFFVLAAAIRYTSQGFVAPSLIAGGNVVELLLATTPLRVTQQRAEIGRICLRSSKSKA